MPNACWGSTDLIENGLTNRFRVRITRPMKPISLTPQEVGSLNIRANQRGVLNKRTIVSGQGNLIGFAGEAMFAKAFPSATKVDSRDYDFVVAGKTIDVKTRGSDKAPRMDWDCKIPTYSFEQQACDIYVFVISRNDATAGLVLGWISKADFKLKARRDRADNLFAQYGKHVVDQEYMIVAISDLNPIESLR